ncbi:hypothetical protein JKY79_00780 [Candidatus Babeliales bacterium]|nr:hypothetical protein [Candidatus Babeliales bacterium]
MNKTMKKRIVTAAFLGLVGSSVQAYELRTPWLTERGPLTYIFEDDKDDDYSLNFWHAVHTRIAQKSFKEHGTTKHPLTELMFGKSDFKLSEAMPNSHADMKTEFYRSALRTAKLRPRAQYNERGITVGGRFEYPVYEDKGRIGLRVTIPFRSVEIERTDWTGTPGDAETNRTLVSGFVVKKDDIGNDINDVATLTSFAMRMDAFEATKQTQQGNSMLFVSSAGKVNAGGSVFNDDSNVAFEPGINDLAFVYNKKEGPPSFSPPSAIAAVEGTSKFVRFDPTVSLQDHTEGVYYGFGKDAALIEKYRTFFETGSKTVCQRLQDQALKEHLWIVKVGDGSVVTSNTQLDIARELYSTQNEADHNEYQWLYLNGVEFKSERRTGLGDIDLDFFYEHRFFDELLIEAMIGVKIPVGGSSDSTGNPYGPRLGNGSHPEVKIGAMLAYQPVDWMSMKVDMYYSFAIESVEHRAAAFEDTQIRHLGPKTDAKVDWGYFVGRFDFNFFHPETKSISSMIGYEIYVKQKDHIRFKRSRISSWLGRSLVVNDAGNTVFEENLQKLDNCVAEKNTDAIAHKVRSEASYRVNKYLELFLGGSYTFAGKNVPQEIDAHGGFRVQF